MIRVLMVCLGNICRSPLAEGILKSKVDNTTVFVDSSGTSAHHSGERPDSRSIDVANDHGLNISNQRSRKFIIDDFDAFDYIYVMDKSNYFDVTSMARNDDDLGKVKMILDELNLESELDVPDPYYGGVDGFEAVYQMLDQACDAISKRLLV